ncbi:MAG: hypothetical protein M3680_26675, partial [Myxococcota bacterium]|nr:hypothetical protein [Myxococcota bacterium]
MIARTVSGAPTYVPGEGSRLTVAPDGSMAAIVEPARIVLVDLPGGAPFVDLDGDRSATGMEVAWIGTPPRLLVLARFADHTRVALVDPHQAHGPQGPVMVAELRLEALMSLGASAGSRALATGARGAIVLAATPTHLTQAALPIRTRPLASGAAGSHVMLALESSIDEWDLQTRLPRRRLRLPRAAVSTAVGGSDRVVWSTTQQDPARIDVMPLLNRGQPKVHELPEPIGHISGHPRSDVLACVGATTGRIYVVDLDGRTAMRVIAPEGLGHRPVVGLVVGRGLGLLVAGAGRPLVFV